MYKTKIRILMVLAGLIILAGILNVFAPTFEQTVTVTVVPEDMLDIISPVDENVYITKTIPLKIQIKRKAESLEYSDNGNPFKTLCKDCDEYGISKKKTKSFREGEHDVVFRAIFDRGEYEETVNFFIDTKKPKIKKTYPKKDFADGYFEVAYQEKNVKELWLNYGNEETGFRSEKIGIKKCYDPVNLNRCVVKVNLQNYDNQNIKYWYNLTDVAGNFDSSKPKQLKVDFSKPVVSYFNYTIDRKRVSFVFEIDEENFKEINYMDLTDKRARWNTLCSRLKNGKCEKREYFSYKTHVLNIEILDEAGNREVIEGIEIKV